MGNMGQIVIDSERCKSCKICMEICPKKLIHPSQNTNSRGLHYAEFDNSKNECIGCAMCAHSCPDVAIVKVYK